MHPSIQPTTSINPTNWSPLRRGFLLVTLTLVSVALCPIARAVDVLPDGNDVNGCVAPPDGLVSWWTGDRTADDLQGTNNGTLLNGTSFTKGMVGPAFRFDGVDDYVQIPHNASLNPGAGDFSVDFWMNTDTSANLTPLLSKREACGPVSFWSLNIQDGLIEAELYSGGLNFNTFLSDISVNDGIWHHVALVRQTTTATLYIDGAVHGSGSTEEIVIIRNNEPLFFGTDVCVGVGRQIYSGELDEIEYFDVALTSSQSKTYTTQAGRVSVSRRYLFLPSIPLTGPGVHNS